MKYIFLRRDPYVLHDEMYTLRMCVCRKYDFGIGIVLLLYFSVLSIVSFSSPRAE